MYKNLFLKQSQKLRFSIFSFCDANSYRVQRPLKRTSKVKLLYMRWKTKID